VSSSLQFQFLFVSLPMDEQGTEGLINAMDIEVVAPSPRGSMVYLRSADRGEAPWEVFATPAQVREVIIRELGVMVEEATNLALVIARKINQA
jgi:hypothetical protein